MMVRPTLLLFIVIISGLVPAFECHQPCSNVYGSAPCIFLPAPPGKTPPCAQPGLTYCEYPENYPNERIQDLIQKWRFNHETLILDETRDDYATSTYYPSPTYSYLPPNTIKDSYFPKPEPIYIPKPPQPFQPHSAPPTSYLPPKLNHTTFTGYPSHLHTYKYSSHIPPAPRQAQYFRPPVSASSFALPHAYDNRIWARKADQYGKAAILARKRRSFLISTNNRKLKSLDLTLATSARNETVPARGKRQAPLVGMPLCNTRSNYIMPRAALNNKGNWMYVVNMPEMDNRYSQLVKSETCVSQTCNGLCQLPIGYTSRCEQKYVQKRLVALEGAGNGLYTDVFWFPSCCVCTISR